MKIIKFSLPVIAVTAVLSVVMNQGLQRRMVATADAGALPASTALFNKMYAQPRLAGQPAHTRPAATRLAAR